VALNTTVYNVLSPRSPIAPAPLILDIDLGPSSKVERPFSAVGAVPAADVDRIIYPPDRNTLWTHLVTWEGNKPRRLSSESTDNPLASVRRELEAKGTTPARIAELLDPFRRAGEATPEAKSGVLQAKGWRARQDSNLRPSVP
jgi:hypothetical protein